ncbi:MAG: leucine-rich repeat protein [Firmicutes bacterium]|nr:leucine-rich repeat protein [Bacillota bacterium]
MENKFGNFIYELRKEKGLTQAELSAQLGLSNKAVSKWETGETMPGIDTLAPLAKALGVSVDELLTGERNEPAITNEALDGSGSTGASPRPTGANGDGRQVPASAASFPSDPPASQTAGDDPSGVPPPVGRDALIAPPSPTAIAPAPPSPKRKKMFILLGAAAGLIAVCAIVLISVLAATSDARAEQKYVRENTIQLTYTIIDESGSALPQKSLTYVYGRTAPELDLSGIEPRPGYALALYTSSADVSEAAVFDAEIKPKNKQVEVWARWAPITYAITYANLLAGSNPNEITAYTVESDTITFALPDGRNGFTGTWDVLSIPKGSTGDKVITAVWVPLYSGAIYPITYGNLSFPGVENPNVYTVFTAENEAIDFLPPTRPGYTGTWDVLSIPKGSAGAKTITAVWTPITYTITYANLDFAGVVNPNASVTEFTPESGAIHLAAPTRPGYTGVWSQAAIHTGSIGDKTVTAAWMPITYTITYLNLGFPDAANPNAAKTTFTVESDTYSFILPTRPGYTGVWDAESIPKGNIGDKTVTAVWTPITYTITYANLDYPGVVNPNASVTEFTPESDAIVFAAPARPGYTGIWSTSSFPKGSYGNKTVTAIWTPVVYTVTYANIGYSGVVNPNSAKTTFTIESDAYTFTVPTRTGYTGGWDTVSIPKGSMGNKTVTAVWTANQYTVTYSFRGGDSAVKTARITFDSAYTLDVPTTPRPYCAFGGWYSAFPGGTRYTGSNGASTSVWKVASDVTVYAFWNGLDDLYRMPTGDTYTVSRGDFNRSVLVIPDEYEGKAITAIGQYAFESMTGLTTVILPDSVTSIANSAFNGCTSLTSVTIGKGLASVGSEAFRDCKKLTEFNFNATEMPHLSYSNLVFYNAGIDGVGVTVNIGANVKQVPAYLFYPHSSGYINPPDQGTPKLKAVNFAPNGVCATIGQSAFYRCRDLTSITIPAGVTTIGQSAFNGGAALNEINYNATNASDLNTMGAFSGAGSASGGVIVNIGANVTRIPSNLFYNEPGIKKVVFAANSVCTAIGGSAFRYCSGLTSISFPASLTSISSNAFEECTSLTSVVIPDAVTIVGSYAFKNCSAITGITIGSSAVGTSLMGGLGTQAFYQCYAVTEINFNAVNMLDITGDGVFSLVGNTGTGITVTIGADVTRIPGRLLRNVAKVKKVDFSPGSVCTSIGALAFYSCTELTAVELPSTVTEIGESALVGCGNVERITMAGGNAYFSDEGDCLVRKADNALVVGCKNSVIPTSVTAIADRAFENCSLTELKLPASVKSIGESAFTRCSGLTTLVIPAAVTDIGSYAFSYLPSVTSVVLPSSVVNIGSNGFNCAGATIFTDAPVRPAGWQVSTWNYGSRPVVWGCTLSGDKTYVVSFTKATANTVTNPNAANGISAPYRAGFVFDGWNTAADGSGTAYALANNAEYSLIPVGTTLYAIWASA